MWCEMYIIQKARTHTHSRMHRRWGKRMYPKNASAHKIVNLQRKLYTHSHTHCMQKQQQQRNALTENVSQNSKNKIDDKYA